jgi:hypothetical protein
MLGGASAGVAATNEGDDAVEPPKTLEKLEVLLEEAVVGLPKSEVRDGNVAGDVVVDVTAGSPPSNAGRADPATTMGVAAPASAVAAGPAGPESAMGDGPAAVDTLWTAKRLLGVAIAPNSNVVICDVGLGSAAVTLSPGKLAYAAAAKIPPAATAEVTTPLCLAGLACLPFVIDMSFSQLEPSFVVGAS